MKNLLCVVIVMVGGLGAAESKTRRKPDAPKTPPLTLASVPAPRDHEICFSPDEPCALKLVHFINSAEKSLDVAIFDITEEQIVHAILVRSKKIRVRVIADARQAKGKYSSVPLLRKLGVNLRIGRQRGIMHNKFTIVDGKRVETGSFNYSAHASEANQENQIYLSGPDIVERYKARFEQMWASARN